MLLVALGPIPRRSTASARTDAKREGAELFATRGCTHCHGENGQGTDDGPPLRELRKHLTARQIQGQIIHGGKQMPAFGDSLSPAEVQSLVSFLRARKWTPVPAAASDIPKQPTPAPQNDQPQ